MTEAKPVVAGAAAIEGRIRSIGCHPCGVVVADTPLETIATLAKANDGGIPVLQVDVAGAARLGLVKVDFLGSKALRQMETTIALARAAGETCPELSAIPLNDEATLHLLAEGRTTGVFQMESAGMARLLRSVCPTSFADVVATSALYRPGPIGMGMHDHYAARKAGNEEIPYLHPDLAQFLSATYGVMIYQEQIMEISQHFAGFSGEEADDLWRACAKKHPDEMAEAKRRFVAGQSGPGSVPSSGRHCLPTSKRSPPTASTSPMRSSTASNPGEART